MGGGGGQCLPPCQGLSASAVPGQHGFWLSSIRARSPLGLDSEH